MYSKTGVVGVGNILLADDGLGVHLVRRMADHPRLPPSVRCIDGGTAAFESLYACEECDRLIVVDAVNAGGKPGAIYNMSVDAWRGTKRRSAHDFSLMDALLLTPGPGKPQTHIRVIGMEPADISPGLEMSGSVKERFRELMDRVLDEVIGKGRYPL